MTLRINKIIYLSLAVILILGISGCTDSKSGILGSLSKSSVSSKLAASESSGKFSEKSYPMSYGSCKNTLNKYQVVYNNGDTLDITWESVINSPCDNKFFGIEYVVKNTNSNDEFRTNDGYAYRIHMMGDVPGYVGPSGYIYWTTDGRVDPSRATGDINEANEFINLGKAKANEIVNRYNSGQLR